MANRNLIPGVYMHSKNEVNSLPMVRDEYTNLVGRKRASLAQVGNFGLSVTALPRMDALEKWPSRRREVGLRRSSARPH